MKTAKSIYTYMQNLLILDPAHKAYLHSQGWTDELIEKHHIVSFPGRGQPAGKVP